jgi:hypothetical protein
LTPRTYHHDNGKERVVNKGLDAINTELYRWAREAHEARRQRDAELGRWADDGGSALLVMEALS